MGSIDYGVEHRSVFGAEVDAVIARARAAGRNVGVRGPGLKRDEWQLVDVDVEVVVATGYSYGSFEKAVIAWELARRSSE